jgi:hypothetical protein
MCQDLAKLIYISYFRQSDLIRKQHHVRSTSSHTREKVSSVNSDKDAMKDVVKHNLIEEEAMESGKVHVRKNTFYYEYDVLLL